MTKSHVYHAAAPGAGLGLPRTDEVKRAFRAVAAGTHLPFQRRRPDGGLDYLLVRKSERVTRLLRAVNKGVFA